MARGFDPQRPQPPAVETARRWLARERVDCATRDLQIEKLDAAYNTELFDLSRSTLGGSGYTTTPDMKDVTTDSTSGRGGGTNPRYSEVPVPMVKSITEDWKAIMAVTPNHKCPPALPGEDASERAADKRERIVAGIYSDSLLDFKIQEGAHYKSLHGAELLYALPDPELKRVRIDNRSAYKTYARAINAHRDLMYMAWDWEDYTDYILEQYPDLEPELLEAGVFQKDGQKVHRPERLRMTEWYDRDNRLVMCHDIWTRSMPWAEHHWGFVPGRVVPNILGVGLWGQADVLYAVQLAQLYSEMLSMMQDGMFQSIYDIPILFDDNKIDKIEVGTTEALQMSSKAHTGSLRQGVKMPEGGMILDILERVMRLGSGWPKVQSSEMDSPIISGKAYAAAQGPVAARAALKLNIAGLMLETVTGFALKLYERHFPNQTITLSDVPNMVRTALTVDRNAVGGPFSFVPKQDIAGDYDVRINFPPGGADQYRASIEQLQMLEANVLSVETVRQNRPGIDPKAERQRVERETREKAALEIEQQSMMLQAQLGLQMQMQAAAQGGAAGGPPAGASPPPGSAAGGPPEVGGGQVMALEAAGTEQPGRRQATAGAVGQGKWDRVTRQEVKAEIAAVTPIRGRVFLMGSIARMGYSEGLIEIGLTEMLDKATITQKTRFGREGRLLFQEIGEDTEPDKSMVEVIPAAAA